MICSQLNNPPLPLFQSDQIALARLPTLHAHHLSCIDPSIFLAARPIPMSARVCLTFAISSLTTTSRPCPILARHPPSHFLLFYRSLSTCCTTMLPLHQWNRSPGFRDTRCQILSMIRERHALLGLATTSSLGGHERRPSTRQMARIPTPFLSLALLRAVVDPLPG